MNRSFNPFQNEHHSVKDTREKGNQKKSNIGPKIPAFQSQISTAILLMNLALPGITVCLWFKFRNFLNPITLISSMKIQVKQFWLSTNVNFIYWVHPSEHEAWSCSYWIQLMWSKASESTRPVWIRAFVMWIPLSGLFTEVVHNTIQLMWRTVSESTQSMWNTYSVGHLDWASESIYVTLVLCWRINQGAGCRMTKKSWVQYQKFQVHSTARKTGAFTCRYIKSKKF